MIVSPLLAGVYGPVSDDMVLVEDLLEATKQVEIPALKGMLDHALLGRGKRMRPALVLLAGTFGDYNLNKLVPLGAAIELLHTASLVHDDVVDGADSRRGRPTANAVFDNALTVLLGDYMFANAAELVTRTDSIPVTRLFAQALMKMTSGELDQDAAAFDVGKDIQNYFWRISGKTASLFSTATEGGAVVAGCDRETQESLRIYGYNLGMAFQIVDDVLDFTGDEAVMGKPAGSDLREGTVTLPGLLLLERYPQDNPIKRYFAARRGRDKRVREERLQEAIAAVRTTEVLTVSMEFAGDYVGRALAGLDTLPPSEARQTLRDLGDHVLTRRS